MDNRRLERLYTVLQANIVYSDDAHPVFIINLSRKGANIRTSPFTEEVSINPGSNLKLLVELPNGYSLSLSCTVVWSQETFPGALAYEIGLSFSDPPLEYLDYLKREGLEDPEDLSSAGKEFY